MTNKDTNLKKNGILVAHPAQQHSYKLAAALEKIDLLNSYCTTIYYKPDKKLYKLLGRILGKNNIKRMQGRQNKFFDKRVVSFNEILGLIYLFIIRLDKENRILSKIYDFMVTRFGYNVARYAKYRHVSAVILYDTTAYSCFNKLKNNKEIIKIVDMSSAAAPYIRKLIINDIQKVGDFSVMYDSKLRYYNERFCKKVQYEIDNSDYFLVPSEFVKESLKYVGVSDDKIIKVPYGVDISRFNSVRISKKNKNDKIRFLFVGRLEAAKGIYYLLEAFKQLNNPNIELVLVGNMLGNNSLYDPYREYFIYEGIKLHREMPNVYNSVDIFVFPSLWEGFSLSIFEAMASGLPLIASENSGAKDVITDGEEGFIVPHGDITKLKEKIIWFVNNKSKIEEMSYKARKCAEKYSWEKYEKLIEDSLNSKIIYKS